ncbi:MAG: hypothetical protein H6523_09955 [Mycolicibacterium sp.]|jgi:very-short-patch-repair endonuclease|nr:hypothetical protein [Mycolicibacterium sp.]
MEDPGVHPWAEWQRRGVTRSALRQGLRNGRFTQVNHGWYAVGGAEPDAVEAVRRGGALSCLPALARHNVWIPPHHQKLHVRGGHRAHAAHPGRYCRQFGRPEPVLAAIDDPLTALRHALRCLDPEGITVVCDSLLNTSLRAMSGEPIAEILTPTEVESAFHGAPGYIRRCLDLCDARAASGTETMVRLRLRSKRVKVDLQVEIPEVGHVDLLAGDRLIIEADSLTYHLGPAAFRADRHRDQQAAHQGLLHMRLTYEDVVYEWRRTEEIILSAIRSGHHRGPRRRKVV